MNNSRFSEHQIQDILEQVQPGFRSRTVPHLGHYFWSAAYVRCPVGQGALTDNGLAPEMLELEITEGVFYSGHSPVLDRPGESGAGVAIDDFGKGYSSCSCCATRQRVQ